MKLDTIIMPFGEYKGEKITHVPAWYLLHHYHKDFLYGDVKQYVKENIEQLEKKRDHE